MSAALRVSSPLPFPLPPSRTGDNPVGEHGCPNTGERTEVCQGSPASVLSTCWVVPQRDCGADKGLWWESSVGGDTFSCGCGPCGSGKCHHSYLNLLGKGRELPWAWQGEGKFKRERCQMLPGVVSPVERTCAYRGCPGKHEPTPHSDWEWAEIGNWATLGRVVCSSSSACCRQGQSWNGVPLWGPCSRGMWRNWKGSGGRLAKALSGVRSSWGSGLVCSGKEEPVGAPPAACHPREGGCREDESQLLSGLPHCQQSSNSHELPGTACPQGCRCPSWEPHTLLHQALALAGQYCSPEVHKLPEIKIA